MLKYTAPCGNSQYYTCGGVTTENPNIQPSVYLSIVLIIESLCHLSIPCIRVELILDKSLYAAFRKSRIWATKTQCCQIAHSADVPLGAFQLLPLPRSTILFVPVFLYYQSVKKQSQPRTNETTLILTRSLQKKHTREMMHKVIISS